MEYDPLESVPKGENGAVIHTTCGPLAVEVGLDHREAHQILPDLARRRRPRSLRRDQQTA
jgi:hypothetical protein